MLLLRYLVDPCLQMLSASLCKEDLPPQKEALKQKLKT